MTSYTALSMLLTPPDHPTLTLGFCPQRGIGQGESASSLMWVAVYDILLDWIEPHNTHLHPFNFADLSRPTHISTPDSHTTRTNTAPPVSNAYADDLATITTGSRAHPIQQQQLNMTKIVPVSIGAHDPHMPKYITVYNHHWQPTQ